MFAQLGVPHFNPDEAARLILQSEPALDPSLANSRAWHIGVELFRRAVRERLNYAFETTLGGETITGLLETAMDQGMEVRVWYAGLTSPELHVARVHARVRAGGHPIPEHLIRARYDRSRSNLIRLLPRLTELRVYDNSIDADPGTGRTPVPVLLLHTVGGLVRTACHDEDAPEWARPILTAASPVR